MTDSKRWERLREKFAAEQASPALCPMFTLPEVAMLFSRIAELETQLADVPEPGEWMAELRTRNARIRELEAKLESARDWAHKHVHQQDEGWEELQAILKSVP